MFAIAFTLIEMAVVIAILMILIVVGAGLYQNSGANARRASVEVISGLLELAKAQAIANRTEVFLAIDEPRHLPQRHEFCRVGLFCLHSQPPGIVDPLLVRYDPISRWYELNGGVVLIGGQVDGVTNVLDSQETDLIYGTDDKETAVKVRLLSINSRGSMSIPFGSGAVLFRVAEGRYQQGKTLLKLIAPSALPVENQLRVGRVTARTWSAN